MSTFQVTPEELTAAGAVVARSVADLGAAEAAVNGTAGAAAGTPVAAAYDVLLGDARRTVQNLETVVDDLSRCLSRAAGNYSRTDGSVAACYAAGGGG